MKNDHDTIEKPPAPKARPRPQDDRPFLVVSFKDERYRVICCYCGQRLIDQGYAKTFPHLLPEYNTAETFRLLMLTLETSFDDVGHIH